MGCQHARSVVGVTARLVPLPGTLPWTCVVVEERRGRTDISITRGNRSTRINSSFHSEGKPAFAGTRKDIHILHEFQASQMELLDIVEQNPPSPPIRSLLDAFWLWIPCSLQSSKLDLSPCKCFALCLRSRQYSSRLTGSSQRVLPFT